MKKQKGEKEDTEKKRKADKKEEIESTGRRINRKKKENRDQNRE